MCAGFWPQAEGTRPVVRYDPSRMLISIHIPKTAGTSFRHVLEGWFGTGLHGHYPSRSALPVRAADGPGVCVHGHFNHRNGAGVRDYYPEARQIITVMRDPFERTLSQWAFGNRLKAAGAARPPDLEDDPSFDLWFDRMCAEAEADPVTRALRHLPEPVTAETADRCFDRDFVAVGLTERFAETIRLFAACLGKPVPPTPAENVTGDGSRGAYARHRRRHEHSFALEHRVYAAARARFDAQFNEVFD